MRKYIAKGKKKNKDKWVVVPPPKTSFLKFYFFQNLFTFLQNPKTQVQDQKIFFKKFGYLSAQLLSS